MIKRRKNYFQENFLDYTYSDINKKAFNLISIPTHKTLLVEYLS